MIVRELEQLPTGRKAIQEFEELVEQSPDVYFNLANTKQPLETEKLSIFKHFNNQLIGLNILLDSCDSLEMGYFQSFTKLEYLRLSFTGCSIDDAGFSCLQGWLLELTDLKAIVISSSPKNKELIEDIVQSLSVLKPFPLTVIYQIKAVGKKSRRNAEDNSLPIPAIGNANIYQAPNVMLNSDGIRDIVENGKLLKSNSVINNRFRGHLEISTGDWTLDVTSLYVEQFKDVVVAFEGFDNDRKFSCMCRCNWHDAEGGYYFASRVPINYGDYNGDSELLTLKLKRVNINAQGLCEVEGIWKQTFNKQGNEWELAGALAPFKSKTLQG